MTGTIIVTGSILAVVGIGVAVWSIVITRKRRLDLMVRISEEAAERVIKSFIYLDEYKMYSISSQIFEGITDYLANYQGTTKEEKEIQKALIRGGQTIADILKSGSGAEEKKYFHDYSYKYFEDYLKESERILSLSAENIDEKIKQIDDVGFVAVRANAVFNYMESSMENFNELEVALSGATEDFTNIEDFPKGQDLHNDPAVWEKLISALSYEFEVQMPIESYIFSSNFNREYLRENEHLLLKKYHGLAEKEFVLVGTIAQGSSKHVDYEEDNKDYISQQSKEGSSPLVKHPPEAESKLSEELTNKIIIDPIALYREI